MEFCLFGNFGLLDTTQKPAKIRRRPSTKGIIASKHQVPNTTGHITPGASTYVSVEGTGPNLFSSRLEYQFSQAVHI